MLLPPEEHSHIQGLVFAILGRKSCQYGLLRCIFGKKVESAHRLADSTSYLSVITEEIKLIGEPEYRFDPVRIGELVRFEPGEPVAYFGIGQTL